jgi:hypothetical protein
MSRWPYAFFAAAAFYILVGTNWGLYMSVTHDFTTSPAHAHLNLLGFVSLSIMGAYYALLGRDTPAWMVKANFVLSNLGVVIMIAFLTAIFTGAAPPPVAGPVVALGGVLVIVGFAIFFAAVIRGLVLAGPPARPKLGGLAPA